jgi:hypothetical protein
LLAICALLSAVVDVAVAPPPPVAPCWIARADPAPTATATAAVADNPIKCLLRRGRGGSGSGYCDEYGYGANGSLMVLATPTSVSWLSGSYTMRFAAEPWRNPKGQSAIPQDFLHIA